MQSSSGSLVECVTQDGLRLNGFLQTADLKKRIWILVHGVASNFYGSSLLSFLAEDLIKSGDSVLRVNTRGHDPMSYQTCIVGVHRGGAAFETLSDSKFDLDAWYEFARRQGFQDVCLLGHSLGAVKSIYFASRPGTPPIEKVVALSPPRLNFDAFAIDQDKGFLDSMAEAKELVARHESERVIKVRYPFPMLISAATYVDKYGSESKYDYLAHLDGVLVPTLFTFGSLEVVDSKASFFEADQAVQKASQGKNWIDVITIPEGDHNYSRSRRPLSKQILQWISQGSN